MEKTVSLVRKPQWKSDDNGSLVESSGMNNHNQETLS